MTVLPKKSFSNSNIGIFLIIFFGTLGFARWYNIADFYFDAALYWDMSGMFTSADGFSFYNMREGFRGYFLPLLLFLGRSLASGLGLADVWGLWLLAALTMAVLFTFILPSLFAHCARQAASVWRSLLPWLCCLFFWPGLVIYPLSDLYACTLIMGATVLAGRMECFRGASLWGAAFAVGFVLYASYNTRTIYLLSLPLFALPLWDCRRWGSQESLGSRENLGNQGRLGRRDMQGVAVVALCAFAGAALAAAPQMLINEQLVGKATAKIITLSLFQAQLQWGLEMQNFLTVLDNGLGGLRLQDPVGLRLLAENAPSEGFMSTGEFLLLVLRHPFEYAGIYLRHWATFLNPVFGEVYVRDLYRIKIHQTLINYAMLCLFAVGAMLKWRAASMGGYFRHREGLARAGRLIWPFMPVVLPCLAISAGAPEIRFLFPLYLLFYGFLAYLADYRDIFAFVRRRPIVFSLCALIALWVLAGMWSLGYASPNVDLPRMLTLW